MASIWMGLMEVGWDDDKAASNLRKHGISFVEAATVFQDTNGLYELDAGHSEAETRFLLLGLSSKQRMMTVVHVEKAFLRLRIISAREATMRRGDDMSEECLEEDDDMRAEYDFTHAIRNPYARLARNGPLVRLDPDVLAVFPDSAAVNDALRMLMKTAKSVQELQKAS